MDARIRLIDAPFRDPRYAPRRLEVEDRGGGELVLTNPTPHATDFTTMTQALARWAREAPERAWIAERSGAGWREVSFSQAWDAVRALAGGLGELGVVGTRPLLILTNGYDGTVTDMYFASAVAAARRGYHVLFFDGPGQGGPLIEQGIPLRPDWETVIRAVVDVAIDLPGIDPASVQWQGLPGLDLGPDHRLQVPALTPAQLQAWGLPAPAAVAVATALPVLVLLAFALARPGLRCSPRELGGAGGPGTNWENPPGWRGEGPGRLYLAYLRDPDGNKLCVLHRPEK